MHWGHAVSPDLLRWKELPIGLYPQKFGDWAFSGSAVVDERNESGFGTRDKPPLVGAYTSTGRGECIVYSNDNGRTWTEYEGNPVVRHVGRDPRLLYHKGRSCGSWPSTASRTASGGSRFTRRPISGAGPFASRIEDATSAVVPDPRRTPCRRRERPDAGGCFTALDGQYLRGGV